MKSATWSELPQQVLTKIGKLLHQSNPLDLLRFRTICKSWHSSFPTLPHRILSPHYPLIISTPPYLDLPPTHLKFTSCALTLNIIYTLHPPINIRSEPEPEPWIAFIGQINPSRVSIRLPFSKSEFTFSHKLNFSLFNASEIGRYYTLDFEYSNSIQERVLSSQVIKVVVISNGFGLILLYRDGKLMFLRLGVRNNVMGLDNVWLCIHNGKDFIFDDILEFNGRMLGVDRSGKVYLVDYKSFELIAIVPCISDRNGGKRRKRLIESLGMLYLVEGFGNHDNGPQLGCFHVYVLDEEEMNWVYVRIIKDRIFMIGREFSVSTSADRFGSCIYTNSVVFTDCSFRKYNSGSVSKLDDSQFPRSKPIAVHVATYELDCGTYDHRRELDSFLRLTPTWLLPDYKLHTCHFASEDVWESISQGNDGDGRPSSSKTCRVCEKTAYRGQKEEERQVKDKNKEKRKVDWCPEDDFLGWHETSDNQAEANKKVGTEMGVALAKVKARAKRAKDRTEKAEKELAEAHLMKDHLRAQLKEEVENLVKLRAEIETMRSTRVELLAAARTDGIDYCRDLVFKALPDLK